MSDFRIPSFLEEEEDEGLGFAVPGVSEEQPEFELPSIEAEELGTAFRVPSAGDGEAVEPRLDLADPRFAELRDVQRQLAEMQELISSGEVSEFHSTGERTELHHRLNDLRDELMAEYGLSDVELRNLVIPTEFPWLMRADADPITGMAREVFARISQIESTLRLAEDPGEDDSLTQELVSAATEFEAYTSALVDKYGMSEEEAQRLVRVPAELGQEERVSAFIDPGGFGGFARGFMEGFGVHADNWIPTDRMSVWGGRLVGTQLDSFVGVVEPFLMPWQMSVNTLSNFAHLQENSDPVARWERLMAAYNEGEGPKPVGKGLYTAWSTWTNVHHAFLLNNSYLYSVIPQLFGYDHPLVDELPTDLRDRGSMFAVNLHTGRANDWVTYGMSFRSNAIGVNVGTSPGIIVDGTDYLDQVGFFERVGVTNPVAQEVMGLVFDFLVDPLLAADIAFAGAKLLRVGGMRAASMQVADAAEKLRRGMTPRGVFDKAWRNLNDPMHPQYYTGGRTPEQAAVMAKHGARSVPERVMGSLGKLFDDIMNLEVPVGGRVSRAVLGITDEEVTRIPMRYFFFTEGVLDLPLPNITNIPQALTGGPEFGPGIRERAIGVARAFTRTALEGSSAVKEIIQSPVAQYRAVSLGNLKVNIPGMGVHLDRRGEAYVRTMNELVWDFADNIGVTDAQRVIRDGISPASVAPNHDGSRILLADNTVRLNPAVPFDPQTADWFEMARNIGRAFEVPEDVAVTSFRAAVREASNISAQLGYQLSDYETYVRMMSRAADNLTERTGRSFDPGFMRAQIEADLAGLDVERYVRTGDVVPLSFVSEVAPGVRGAADNVPPAFVVDLSSDRLILDEALMARVDQQMARAGAMVDGPDKTVGLAYLQAIKDEYTELVEYLGATGWRQLGDGSTPQVTWEKLPQMAAPEAAGPGPEWFRYDMNDYELFRREVMSLFTTEGNPFAHLSPEVYMAGLHDGYLRRTFGTKLDPLTISARVQMRDVALFPSSVNSDNMVGRVRATFGDDAADAVNTYLAGRSENQIIFTEEVFDIISRTAGVELPGGVDIARTVAAVREQHGGKAAIAARAYLEGQPLDRLGYSVDDIAGMISALGDSGNPAVGRWNLVNDVIYGEDFDYNFLNDTMKLIAEQQRDARAIGGASGFDPTMTPGSFQARQVLDLDQRTQLLQLKDAPASLSALAGSGARAMRSQTMLRDAYDFFRQNRLLYSLDDLTDMEVAARFNYGHLKRDFETLGPESWRQIWDTDGRRWVQIPDNQGQWGPLAGSVVPRDVGRWMMLMSQTPGEMLPSFVKQGLNLYRRLLLAPYPTVMRNLYGQFVIAQQNGVDLIDMIRNLPRAGRARAEYLSTGSSPTMQGGERYVGFFEDITQSAAVRDQVQLMLESLTRPEVLRRIQNTTTAQGRIEEIGKVVVSALDSAARAPFPRIGAAVQLEGATPVTRAVAAAGNWLSGATARSQLNPMGRIPSFGALDTFTYVEELTRAAIYLTVMDNAVARGIPLEQATRMGAHAGNHAVNNYANVPLVVSRLRDTGLGLFPAFTYLQASRVVRSMWQNPQALTKQQHLIRGASNVLSPGMTEEERDTLFDNMPGFMRGQPGIWVSAELFGGEGQHYWRIPVEKIFPMGVGDFLQYGEEVSSGGVYNPIIDAVFSLLRTDGLAPFASQYGRGRVYEPTDSWPVRITKALGWVAESYQPGQLREIRRGVDTIEAATGPFFDADRAEIRDYREDIALEMGRYMNRDPEQFMLRQLGLNLYVVDALPRESVSETARLSSIQAQVSVLQTSVRRQARQLASQWPPGHPEYERGMERIEGEMMRSLRDYAESLEMSWDEAQEYFGPIYEEFR